MNEKTLKRLIDEFLVSHWDCNKMGGPPSNNDAEFKITDGLSEHITKILEQEKFIKSSRNKILQEENELEKKYRADKEKIRLDKIQLEIHCPHYEYTFYGDPSGGNDSFNKCDWCGYQW